MEDAHAFSARRLGSRPSWRQSPEGSRTQALGGVSPSGPAGGGPTMKRQKQPLPGTGHNYLTGAILADWLHPSFRTKGEKRNAWIATSLRSSQ